VVLLLIHPQAQVPRHGLVEVRIVARENRIAPPEERIGAGDARRALTARLPPRSRRRHDVAR
jgi:hypothetical protein